MRSSPQFDALDVQVRGFALIAEPFWLAPLWSNKQGDGPLIASVSYASHKETSHPTAPRGGVRAVDSGMLDTVSRLPFS